MPSTDSNTDIEVEFNAAGQAVFVTTGIHAGIDTVSKGCDKKGWVSNEMIFQYSNVDIILKDSS